MSRAEDLDTSSPLASLIVGDPHLLACRDSSSDGLSIARDSGSLRHRRRCRRVGAGPRLVTPTVTVPVAGKDCGEVLAQAPAPTNMAAESERRTQAPADGLSVSITASSLLRAYQGRPLGLDRLGRGQQVYAVDVQQDGSTKNHREFVHLPSRAQWGSEVVPMAWHWIQRADCTWPPPPASRWLTRVVTISARSACRHWYANLAFGGPSRRTLYLTAAESLFRIQMLSEGRPERAK